MKSSVQYSAGENRSFSETPIFEQVRIRLLLICGLFRFSNITLFVMLLLGLFSFVSAAPLQRVSFALQQTAQEYELKAVYLYNFLQFVQWPESHHVSSKDGAMVIGVLGESPFGKALDELQADVQKSDMKPVRIVHFGPYREDLNLRNCNLLFISASERTNFSRIISALKGSAVLTVSDTEGFLSSGGMINLVHSKGRIRWMINRMQTDRAGLRLSAQLLSIATKVLDGPEQ